MRWRRTWIRERERGGVLRFYVEWIDDLGRRRSDAAGTERSAAEGLRCRREGELNSGTGDAAGRPRKCRLSAFRADFLGLRRGTVQPATFGGDKALMELFEAFMGDVDLATIKPATVERFRSRRAAGDADHHAVQPATLNKELRCLKGIFAHGVRLGYLASNPAAGIKRLREAEPSIRVLTVAEVGQLLRACRTDWWRMFVALALTTGLRRGELLALRWVDVDFDRATLAVRNTVGHRTKSGKTRVVPLAGQTLAMLRGFRLADMTSERIFGAGQANMPRAFRTIVKRARLKPPCTLHDLRKTYCTHLAMAGVAPAVTQKLLGHADAKTTERYYTGVLPEVMQRAPESLPYLSAIGGAQVGPEPPAAATAKTARSASADQAVA